jgi:hypothetical protein
MESKASISNFYHQAIPVKEEMFYNQQKSTANQPPQEENISEEEDNIAGGNLEEGAMRKQ